MVAFGVIGGSVSSASAHHPEVSATADCAGLVSWTSEAWVGNVGESDYEASRTNSDVLISYSVNGGAYVELEHVVYEPDDFRASGTFSVPAPLTGKTVRVRAKAVDDWGNGSRGGQVATSGSVGFSQCPVPAPEPVASVAVDCEGFVVLLDNSEGTADAVFTVVGPEGDSELVTVPAGESGSCEFPVTEDAEKTVTVTASGMEAVSATYTADCVPPVEALPTEILPAEAFAGVPAVPAVPAVAGVTGVLPQGAGSSQWLPLLAFGMLAAGGVLLLTRRASRVSTNRRR